MRQILILMNAHSNRPRQAGMQAEEEEEGPVRRGSVGGWGQEPLGQYAFVASHRKIIASSWKILNSGKSLRLGGLYYVYRATASCA